MWYRVKRKEYFLVFCGIQDERFGVVRDGVRIRSRNILSVVWRSIYFDIRFNKIELNYRILLLN